MICSNCGQQISNNSKFCPLCGNSQLSMNPGRVVIPTGTVEIEPPVTGKTDYTVPYGKKNNTLKYLLLVAYILGILAIIILALILYQKRTGDTQDNNTGIDIATDDGADNIFGTNTEDASDNPDDEIDNTTDGSDVNTSDDADANTSDFDDSPADTDENDDFLQTFNISSSARENYYNALDYTDYDWYYSDIDMFYFKYPGMLYNNVSVSENSQNFYYGREIQTVEFLGSDGGRLIYRVVSRNEYDDIDHLREYICDREQLDIYEPYVITNEIHKDTGYGRIILTGYTNSRKTEIIYYVITVTDRNVYTMYLQTGSYDNENDKMNKQYVTECCYRMTGFSLAKNAARPYREFCEEFDD